ncbi:hypothetical protein [Mycobacterium canetti]|uniref:hypothetical protein n=1 Tax=Mycobacterium canetti TaxID=78331 RepID=UPI00187D7B70|nr:hypothetical protein [Mycobacterium canetti]
MNRSVDGAQPRLFAVVQPTRFHGNAGCHRSEGNDSPCKAFPRRHTDSRLVLIARPDVLCSRGPEAMRAKAADLDLAAAAKTVGVQPAADQVAALAGDDGAGRKPSGRPGNRDAYRRAETPPRICAKPAG